MKQNNTIIIIVGLILLLVLNNLGFINLFAVGALSEEVRFYHKVVATSSGMDFPHAYIVSNSLDCPKDVVLSSGKGYTTYKYCELKPQVYNKVGEVCVSKTIGIVTSAEVDITYRDFECYDRESEREGDCDVRMQFFGFDGVNYVNLGWRQTDTTKERDRDRDCYSTIGLNPAALTDIANGKKCFDIYVSKLVVGGEYGAVWFRTTQISIQYEEQFDTTCDVENSIAQFGEDYYVCRNSEWTSVQAVLELDSELINQLQLTLAEKQEIIKSLEGQIDLQIELISKLQLTLFEKLQIVQDLTANIELQAVLINELTVNLEEKAYLVSKLQATNEDQAALISAMELSFEDQAGIIDLLGKEISDDAEIIANLELSLEGERQLIELLQLTIDEQAVVIVEFKLSLEEERKLTQDLTDTVEEQKELFDKIESAKQFVEKDNLIKIWEDYKILIIIAGLFLVLLLGGRKR